MGARLKALREARGEVQAVVAEAVGIERASLSMLENDRDKPGRDTLFALAKYYMVSADYLETGASSGTATGYGRFVSDPIQLSWIDALLALPATLRELHVRLAQEQAAAIEVPKQGGDPPKRGGIAA